MDDRLVQIDVIPGQRPEFAGSQAEGDGQDEQRLQPAVAGGPSRPSWFRQWWQVVSARSVLMCLMVASLRGLGSAGQLAGFGGGVGGGLTVVADLDDGDVADRLAGGRAEHVAGLLLGHGARGVSGLALGQVHEVSHVPADQVVPLRAADRPAQRALEPDQGPLAEHPATVVEESFDVLGAKRLELGLSDLRIDPFLGLAPVLGNGLVIDRERVEPVADTLLDRVGRGGPDARP